MSGAELKILRPVATGGLHISPHFVTLNENFVEGKTMPLSLNE